MQYDPLVQKQRFCKKDFLPCKTNRYNTMKNVWQGMVDGSASKPSLRQDTGYMVEKTYYDIAQYLGAFGAYLMPQ